MKIKQLLLSFLFTLSMLFGFAQDDLFSMMDSMNDTEKPEAKPVFATFKSTRIINVHSIEMVDKQHLDFRISHRFGTINGGFYELWGLDNASIRLGFEYGLSDKVMIGLGRSSYNKMYDAFIKIRVLEQKSGGVNSFPFSMAILGSSNYKSIRLNGFERHLPNRMSHNLQVLIARKFSPKLSLQVSPSLVHRNLVELKVDPHDLLALGLGGRYKLSQRLSFNFDYFLLLNAPTDHINSLSIGVDIETGGHVFQLHMTNSAGMVESAFIGETTESWKSGGIYFGFNISRVFSFKSRDNKGKHE